MLAQLPTLASHLPSAETSLHFVFNAHKALFLNDCVFNPVHSTLAHLTSVTFIDPGMHALLTPSRTLSCLDSPPRYRPHLIALISTTLNVNRTPLSALAYPCTSTNTSPVMAKTSAKRAKVAEESNATTHADVCEHHTDLRAGICTAVNKVGTKCTYRATATIAGFLPTCRIHQNKWKVNAGKCQAIAKCGQVCNRVSPYDAPYHLCSEHEKGTDTLPCHFMLLPSEMRVMIFGYLFPELIPSANPYDCDKIHDTNVSVLRLNKLIYKEASLVLYGDVPFHARVTPTTITILGKTWHRSRFNSVFRSEPLDINQALYLGDTKRIRNLVVEVAFGKWRAELQGHRWNDLLGGVVTHGITNENYDLYEARDSVRKLVEIFSASEKILKRVTVQPNVGTEYQWSAAESVAAMSLVLEPFRDLRVLHQTVLAAPKLSVVEETFEVAYQKLRDEWTTAVRARALAETSTKAVEAKAGYRKIEDLVQLVKEEESQHYDTLSNGQVVRSKYRIFDGIERPLHLARVARENEDAWMIDQIRKAIAKRLAISQRQERRANNVISNAIKSMMVNTDTASPSKESPDVLQVAAVEALPDAWMPDHRWAELQSHNINAIPLPKRGNPGVTIEEDSLRMYYHQGHKTWIRLKTPAVVRMRNVGKELSGN
jgi:hypothetical protein